MSFMRKEDTTSITTKIPSGVSHQAVIDCLHDHDLLIRLGEAVQGYKLLKGDPTTTAEYSVTDKKPVIGNTTFEMDVTNQVDGVDQKIVAHPPLGEMRMSITMRVLQEASGWVLKEDVTINANRAMVGSVKSGVEKSHAEQHAKVIEKAKTRGV